jgi:hypothetical protein
MKATVRSVSLRDQFSYVNSGGSVSARSSTPDCLSYSSLAASVPSIRKNRRIEMRLIGGLVPARLSVGTPALLQAKCGWCAAEDDRAAWGNGKKDVVVEMILRQRRDVGEVRHFRARTVRILKVALVRARTVAVRSALG